MSSTKPILYSNGKLAKDFSIQGEMGIEKDYYPNGQLRHIRILKIHKGGKTTANLVRETYLSNPKTGQITVKTLYWDIINEKYYDEQGNGLKNGILKIYDLNGKLTSELTLKGGKHC